MKIVISPDSFKESLSAVAVSEAIARGFKRVWPDAEYVLLPMADGGEGTVETLVAAADGRLLQADVTGPMGDPVRANYGLINGDKTAVIEVAEASGLHRVPSSERDPRRATSYGTGELILTALDDGARHILMGLGGSATNDGGAGLLQALGARLTDKDGHSLKPGGAALTDLHNLDLSTLDPRLNQCQIDVASDVTNVLCGKEGATAIFGTQKGATPDMVTKLDACLTHFGHQLEAACGKAIINLPGAGAAGGIGAALMGALDADLQPGSALIARAVGLPEAMHQADLVITGEGRLDSQTAQGKTPMGVARIAQEAGVPVIALGGSLASDADSLTDHGFSAVFGSVQAPMALENALNDAAENMERLAGNVAATLKVGKDL